MLAGTWTSQCAKNYSGILASWPPIQVSLSVSAYNTQLTFQFWAFLYLNRKHLRGDWLDKKLLNVNAERFIANSNQILS